MKKLILLLFIILTFSPSSFSVENEMKRSMENVRYTLDQSKGKLYEVYLRHLDKSPELKGWVVLTFSIQPSGSVTKALVYQSNMPDKNFKNDLVRELESVSFGQMGTDTVSTKWKLDFNPEK